MPKPIKNPSGSSSKRKKEENIKEILGSNRSDEIKLSLINLITIKENKKGNHTIEGFIKKKMR